MRTTTRIIPSVLLLVLLASPVSAGWYVGGYAGVAIPNKEDFDLKTTANGVNLLDGIFRNVDLDNSPVFGGKLGYFFARLPYLGFEMDAYHFRPDADSQTVNFSGTILGVPFTGARNFNKADIAVTSVGLNVLFRLNPGGTLQPYAGVGGAATIANFETTVLTRKDDDTDVAAAFQALGGLKLFPIGPNLALFAEYKYLRTGDFKFRLSETDPVLGAATKLDVKTDLTAHLVYGGIALHF